jgi:hypothetical protein
MKKPLRNLFITVLLLFVLISIPFSHTHAHTFFDPNCPADIVQISLVSYSLILMTILFFIFQNIQGISSHVGTVDTSPDIYKIFINKAPPLSL